MRTRMRSLGTGLRASTPTFARFVGYSSSFSVLHLFTMYSLSQVLLQAGYVLEPDCNTRGNQIRDSGRQFYDGKYKKHFDNLFSSVGDWFKAMGEDPTNKRFGEDWARLTKDLLFDSEGSLKFKPELWSDIRKVIVPTLVDKVPLLFFLPRLFSILNQLVQRSATSPSPASSIPTTRSISSSKILRYPDAISSPTSCPSRPTISSNFRPILLSPTSTTTSSLLLLARCRLICGMSRFTLGGRLGLGCLILDWLISSLAGRV